MARKVLDCRGMNCTGPLMATARKMQKLKPGDMLEVWVDDLASEFDIPAWCQQAGHTIVRKEIRDDYYSYLIRKKGSGV
ncbi:sulfurtransferase TusA family protein [Neomoorella carbonis]|uniref:sulfurtransferase TusA family protein n=1 Tax=Neomoorella carbonis TaxID=3062783 RepID=UPI0032466423